MLTSWGVVAVVGAVAFTQLIGWDDVRAAVIMQALTPYLGLLLVPVASWGLWRRSYTTVTISCAIGFGLLVLATPLAFPATSPAVADHATLLRVGAVNLLYTNDRTADIAADLGARDLDVIVFNEYTPAHRQELLASPLADHFGQRIERPGPGGAGVAVWSRRPSTVNGELPDLENESLDVTIDGPDGDIRLLAVHPPPPVNKFDGWRRDLNTIERIARSAGPNTLLVGDLNVSPWHPTFRRLLDSGFTDAHAATGNGFSTSWPADGWIPAFVRIDHALFSAGLAAPAVEDFDVPGSDHRGFVVSVATVR